MANRPTPSARIAAIRADIAEVQSVWADSDDQERAFFSEYVAEKSAEIAAVAAEEDAAKGRRNWRRSAKRFNAAVRAFADSSDFGFDAANAERDRVVASIDRAEAAAFGHDVDVSEDAADARVQANAARDSAVSWHNAKEDAFADVSAERPARNVSEAERQYHADVRAAFRA